MKQLKQFIKESDQNIFESLGNLKDYNIHLFKPGFFRDNDSYNGGILITDKNNKGLIEFLSDYGGDDAVLDYFDIDNINDADETKDPNAINLEEYLKKAFEEIKKNEVFEYSFD